MQYLRNIYKAGLRTVATSHQLLFVVVLLFIFPFFYLTITDSFISAIEKNIETVEKRRIAVLHDAIAVLLQSYDTNEQYTREFLDTQKVELQDVTEIRIVKKTPSGYLILASHTDEKEGSFESITDIYTLPQSESTQSLIVPFETNGVRTWQAVRAVSVEGDMFYILSEHSFASLDSIMDARVRQAYLGLTAIFAFLIAVAYWLGRQIDWQKRHHALAEQLKERDLFTNMIAHEFRTPLTAIRGYGSFLAESKTISDKEKEFVAIMQQSTERLLALINDFLEVARIQSGKLHLEPTSADIQPTIIAVVETLTPLASQKGLTLSFHKLAVPVVLTIDTNRLYQILQNLISNAIKYTEKGSVDITLDFTPKTVSIRIKDTGMGIASDDQAKLFSPFSRVGGVDAGKISGTGLGMWITKQLVEIQKGTISVESIKDVGTHVVVVFKR